MPGPKFTASFADAPQFLTAFAQQIAHGGLLVLGAVLPAGAALTECTVAVQIDGLMAAEVPARIAGATPGLGVMVMFDPPDSTLKTLAEKLRKDPHALVLEAAAIEEA
ncbi:MAG: hypothetical protein JST92_16850, partial [Deltaproteobacteria bacterium]|nr:hypothetical protein [Deltaproteobacteria bacterium]